MCQTFSNIGVLAGRKHKKRLGSEALTRLLGSYSDHVTGFQGQVTGRKGKWGEKQKALLGKWTGRAGPSK